MANKIRGEVHVPLDGLPAGVTLRPTFQALADVEGRTGKSVITILRGLRDGDLLLRDAVEIVDACAVDDVSREDIENGMLATGILEYVRPIAELLIGAVGGNSRKGKKETSPGTGSGR